MPKNIVKYFYKQIIISMLKILMFKEGNYMETKWNLDSIYTSCDCEQFKADISMYNKKIDELNSWCDKNFENTDNAASKLEEYINLKNRLLVFDKLSMYIQLSLAVDTTNSALLKANDSIEQISQGCAYHDTKLVEFIKNIEDIDKIIEQSEVLKEHSFFIHEKYELGKHILSPEEESIVSKMQSTGSSMWAKLWDQLSSNLTADIDGEEISLSEVRNMAYSHSGEKRKKAYFAELEAYKKIELPVSFCLNGIKGEVLTTSKLRNYSSPLEMTLKDSRIDQKILDAMFGADKNYLPKLREFFYKKARLLGYKKSLPFYELFAPVGESEMKFTVEEARDFVVKCFYGFSKDMGDFAVNAFENHWIDLLPKKGKVGGAFCETIHSIKESRILTNFGGTFNDVVTIAHELGHAFHNTRLFDNTEINSFYPMPIAETASTFCESIVINEALKSADENERLVILENYLSGLTQCIIDIYSRFLFEDAVFNRRKDGSLSVEELQDIMEDAQIKAYGDGLDKNYLHKDMWVCKPHYYDAEFNYYNFPYAFGSLLSKGLYAMYTEDSDGFIKLYDKFLSVSSKNKLADVAKVAGIDLYSEDFWSKGLDMIVNEIEDM